MDEMKINSKFMKNIVSKMITKVIYKKYGYNVDICLDNLDVSINNGEAKINVNAEIKLDNKSFTEIMKKFI